MSEAETENIESLTDDINSDFEEETKEDFIKKYGPKIYKKLKSGAKFTFNTTLGELKNMRIPIADTLYRYGYNKIFKPNDKLFPKDQYLGGKLKSRKIQKKTKKVRKLKKKSRKIQKK